MLSWRMRAAAALRFKQNEHDVFRQLFRRAAGDLSRDIFRELAEMDRGQVSRLRPLAETGADELDEDAAHALRELIDEAEAARDEADAVRLGAELKRAACEFYTELSAAADNAFERLFYRQLADEERASLLCLLDCQEYLTDPPAYFILKERAALEG
jgi:rubrerythrin